MCIRDRLSDGSWRTPFDPISAEHRVNDYCEGNAWQYLWLVPQDPEGLIELLGGDEEFNKKYGTLQGQYDTAQGQYEDLQGKYGQLDRDYLASENRYGVLKGKYGDLEGRYDTRGREYRYRF